jgi:hypothetical protein
MVMIGSIITNLGTATTSNRSIITNLGTATTSNQLGIILDRTFVRTNVYQVDVYQNIVLLSSGKIVKLTFVDAALDVLTERY